MNNIRILILEDYPLQAAALAGMLRKVGYEVVGIANAGEQAIKMFRELSPDVAMLDIEVNGAINGIEAGKVMMEIRKSPHIYLTAYDDKYFDDAILTHPAAFFSKPYNERDLQRAIELAIKVYAQNIEPEVADAPERVWFPSVIISRDCLWIKQRSDERERFLKIPISEVLYIKSDNVYLEFHVANRERPIVIVMGITQFSEAIAGRASYKNLVRTKLSYIVNIAYVASFTKGFDILTLTNKTEIPVSERYRPSVQEALAHS